MARILCVEDEPDIRDDLIEELTDFGHTVASAANGEEGLATALAFGPEIILCDCLMPVMTGLEMFAALRERHPELNAVPFVFLSAHAEKSHREEGLKAGADAYLTKPVDFEELHDVLAGLIAAAPKNT